MGCIGIPFYDYLALKRIPEQLCVHHTLADRSNHYHRNPRHTDHIGFGQGFRLYQVRDE